MNGVRQAMIGCAGIVAAGGLTGGLLLRDDEPGGLANRERPGAAKGTIVRGQGRDDSSQAAAPAP